MRLRRRPPGFWAILRPALLVGAAALVLLAGCASLVQREADKQLRAGQREQALHTLEEGLRTYPENASLRSQYLRLRDETLEQWLADARRLRSAGQRDAADHALARAKALDPSNARVSQLVQSSATERRLMSSVQEAQRLMGRDQSAAAMRVIDEGLKADPDHEGLLALRRQVLAQQREHQLKTAQTGLAEQRPISLDFRDAPLRQVLDVVTRYSGLNFVLDKDIRQDLRVTVYLQQVRIDSALDLIVGTHQLARKVLDDRTVLIYPNTPEKQREYQEQVIRVFYLASAEAKGAAAFLKSMLKLKEPFVDERSNMLALRETPETVALAERLIGLYDTQEPEVLLELEVLEVRSTRLTELGVKLPGSVSLTPLPPAEGGPLSVANLRRLGEDRIGVSVGGVTINLRREVGDFEILANPRVRARNREKAKVLIGDKVPIITTTTGQAGFVSDTVSYLDVGLKLEIEPTVFANDEVAIRLALEVGSLAGQIKTGSGTVAYQISTRNASTSLRLKDGETQLLAGLLSKEDRSSASRVPLAGDLPVLGRLFSSQLDDGSRTELVLAVTPRIVRNLRQPEPSESELWVGTEAYTRLRQVGGRVAPEPTRASPTAATGPAGLPGASAPADGGSAAAGPLVLRWQPPPPIKAGQAFTLALDGDLGSGLRGLNLELRTAPAQLRLLEVKEGSLWRQGEAKVSLSSSSDERSGAIVTGVLRNQATSATGSGRILEWTLVASKAGALEVTLANALAVATDAGRPPVALPASLVLEVLP
ncbi:MAG: general secretion pathway protein GspD [Burkholderiales bacterium]|nr:general secretion pathway protein GspD [Burkholderiales bacterium]